MALLSINTLTGGLHSPKRACCGASCDTSLQRVHFGELCRLHGVQTLNVRHRIVGGRRTPRRMLTVYRCQHPSSTE